jgi:hypothetical protein
VKIYVAAVEALKKREDRMKLTTKLVKNLVWLPVISHAKFSFPVMPLSYYAKTDHSRPLIAGLYGYSIGNGPCTLINIMTTLQVSSFAKKKKGKFTLPYNIRNSYRACRQSTLHGLARSVSDWKRRKKFSFFYKGEHVLNSHALKNKVGPAWDIFHGCMKEFPSIAINTFLCFFHSYVIDPRKILDFFILTCSHYKQMSLSIPDSSVLFMLLSFTTAPMFVFTKPSSLFSSSNKISLQTYACSFMFFG